MAHPLTLRRESSSRLRILCKRWWPPRKPIARPSRYLAVSSSMGAGTFNAFLSQFVRWVLFVDRFSLHSQSFLPLLPVPEVFLHSASQVKFKLLLLWSLQPSQPEAHSHSHFLSVVWPRYPLWSHSWLPPPPLVKLKLRHWLRYVSCFVLTFFSERPFIKRWLKLLKINL